KEPERLQTRPRGGGMVDAWCARLSAREAMLNCSSLLAGDTIEVAFFAARARENFRRRGAGVRLNISCGEGASERRFVSGNTGDFARGESLKRRTGRGD